MVQTADSKNMDPNSEESEDQRNDLDFLEGEEHSPLPLSPAEPSCQQQLDEADERGASPRGAAAMSPIPSTRIVVPM